jgi:hypothetical protein
MKTKYSSWRIWRFVFISAACIVLGIPIAATFSVPYTFTFVELPGIIIAFVVACICVACFVLCPRRPIAPKIISLVLMLPAIECVIKFVGYYHLYLEEMANKVLLK